MSAALVALARGEGPSGLGGPRLAWARAVLLPPALFLWCLHLLAGPRYVLQIDAEFGPHMPLSLSGVRAPLTTVAHLLDGYWSGRIYGSWGSVSAASGPWSFCTGSGGWPRCPRGGWGP